MRIILWSYCLKQNKGFKNKTANRRKRRVQKIQAEVSFVLKEGGMNRKEAALEF